jgi:hypothetical protein
MATARTLTLGSVAASLFACSPPRPTLAGAIPLDVRVRVTARALGPGWYPGRLIQSEDRCRMVTVATAGHQEPVALLNMGQIDRLQISRASKPPDWWSDPIESEGWTEIEPARLRDESVRCRGRYPSGVQR